MSDERQILLSPGLGPTPRRPVILFSFFSHCVVLALIVIVWRNTANVHIVHEEYKVVQNISAPPALLLHSTESKPRKSQAGLLLLHKILRPARAPEPRTTADGTSTQALHERAKQATARLMTDIRQRQIYGFTTTDSQLAVHMAGELPFIPAADLPPRFEQYVMVDIIIDVDGRVAEAQIVGGMVPPKIEQTLLAAIREFKYKPAQRNGAPIPSQLEIVVHVPS